MNWSYFIVDWLSLDDEGLICEKFTGIKRRKLDS